MTPGSVLSAALCAAMALSVNGCAARLPSYQWDTPEQAVRLLNQRTEHVQSLGGRGTVMLSRPDQQVVLDAVLAANGENLRLRAYKFDRAIFDLTLGPEGAWLWQAPAHAKADLDLAGLARLSAGGDAATPAIWTMLMGRVPANSKVTAENGSLIARTPLGGASGGASGGGGGVMVTEIDPRTLTVRAYHFEAEGSTAPAIRLSEYELIDGTAWPMWITIEDASGVIDIRLAEVTLNAALPTRAFEPPKGAVRLGAPR